jgi:hypothetical protein
VEFRVEQHLEALKDRLGMVGLAPRRTSPAGKAKETKNPTYHPPNREATSSSRTRWGIEVR